VNQGRGAAVTTGIRQARGDVAGYIDIDCEVSPVYLPLMIAGIEKHEADVIIGKRIYLNSIRSLIRFIASWGYRSLTRVILQTHDLDTESGYKIFNRKKILPIILLVQSPGWFWDTETIVLADRFGLTISEMPVLFQRRFDKQSSVRLFRDTIQYLKDLWAFYFRLRFDQENIFRKNKNKKQTPYQKRT